MSSDGQLAATTKPAQEASHFAVPGSRLESQPANRPDSPVQKLQNDVHDLQTNGNIQPVSADIASGRAQSDKLFGPLTLVDNAANIGATMLEGGVDAGVSWAQSVGDGLADMGNGIASGAKTIAGGMTDTAQWAGDNPGKAAAIAGIGVALAAAEIYSGGMATAAVAPLLTTAGGALAAAGESALTTGGAVMSSSAMATGLNVAAAVSVVATTSEAAREVSRGGEMGVLMDRQDNSPQEVAAAEQQLKSDTGTALFTDAALGAGLGIRAALALGVTANTSDIVASTAAGADTASITLVAPISAAAEVSAQTSVPAATSIEKGLAASGSAAAVGATALAATYNSMRAAGQAAFIINGVGMPLVADSRTDGSAEDASSLS